MNSFTKTLHNNQYGPHGPYGIFFQLVFKSVKQQIVKIIEKKLYKFFFITCK